MKPTESKTISHEAIAARAHAIWEQSGRPNGFEAEHWLRAEQELHEMQDADARAKKLAQNRPAPRQ